MEFNENQDIAKNQINALLGREDISPIEMTLNSIRNQAKQPTGLIDTSYKTEDNSLFSQPIQDSGKPSLTQKNYNVEDAFAFVGGEYVQKFDTYERGVDNMERHAQRQSTMDKWINGTTKALGKTAGAIVGGTVGIGYGITSAIGNQNFDNLYDNDFSNWLNDLDQKMNYKLPNYYTKQEQEKGLFGQAGTANFWSDKVLGGLSFTAGAIVSEGIWAYATGGVSLASVGARWGTKALSLTKVGGSIGKFSNILKKALPTKMLAGVTSKTAAIRGGQIGEALNTARFTMTSAGYESSVEALHFKKEAEENFYNNFESINGRPPNQEDITTFEENLSSSANAVFASNMAIVGSSNLMAFGKIFNIKSPIKTGMTDFLDKKIYGLGLNNASKVLTPTRLQGINRKVLPYVRSMVEEGLYEEGMQSVTSSSANKWVEHTYNPETQLESFDMAGAVYDSMAHQYGTKEGWVENGVGMIIGIIGEAGTRGRSADVTSKEAKFKQEEAFAQTYTQKALGEHMLMLTRIKGFSQEAEKANQSGNLTAEKIATDGVMNALFNHGHQIGRDINDTIEHMSSSLDTLTADQFKEMGIEESQIDAYKEETLTAFKETAQQFTQNRKYAEYMIGRNQLKGLGDIQGNLLEGASVEVSNELLIQALTYTLTAGESSGKIMDDIISTIGTEVGEGYEASLKVARKLGGQKGATVREVNKTVKQIQAFEQERKALMQELVTLQNAPKELEPNRQEGGRLGEVNVRLSELNNTIESLNNTLSTLTEKINSNKEFRKEVGAVETSTLMNSENEISTDDLLSLESNIEKLEALIENYRGVNPQKAAYLEELLKEFENANDLFRANQRTAIALSSGELKLGNINSWVQKKLEKSGSLDQFTNDWLTDLLTNYTSSKVKTMSQSIEDTENISDEAYQDFLDSNKEEVPSEIINSLVVKVVNEEPLSDREKEMYEAKKGEIEDLVKQTVKPVNKEKEALEKLNKEEKEALDKLEKEISEEGAVKASELKVGDKLKAKQSLISKNKIEIVEKNKLFHLLSNGKPIGIFNTLLEAEQAKEDRLNTLADSIINSTIDIGGGVVIEGITVDGTTYSVLNIAERMVTIVDINGIKVPFYLTTGLGGKNLKPSWYPMFGYSESGWLNKTNGVDMESFYERLLGKEVSEKLKEVSKKLDNQFGITPNSIKQTGIITATQTYEAVNNTLPFETAENQKIDATVDAKVELEKLESNIKTIGNLISNSTVNKTNNTTRDYNKEAQKIKEEFQKKREKLTGVQKPKTKKEVVRDRLEELIKTKFYSITSIINPDGSIAVVKPTEAEIEEYRELLTQPTDGLFTQNQVRLEELKQKLGQWRLLDSAIGDDNTSLAELIEQLSQLEQEVEQEETLLEITPEDSTLLNDEIETTAKQDDYELAQNTLAAVTVRATDTHYNFSHLSPLALIRRVGGDVEMNTGKVVITSPTIEQIENSEAGTVFTVDGFTFRKKDKAGTIEVKKEDFNSNSQRINMFITNTGAVKWSYKDVYEFNGVEFVKVNSSYEENIEPQEIYNLKPTDKVTFEVAEEDVYTQKLLDKYNKATKKEKKDQAFQELIAGVKIYVVNKDGVKVSILKALRGSTQDDTMLEIRKAATDAILQGVSKVPMEVEVSNIFMGSPRFKIDNNGNIQNIEFTDKATTTVLATGYVQNGELILNKDFTDEVNKTYIGQISKKNNSKKIPVVVIQKGVYKVAYPISVKKTKAEKGHLVEAVLQQSLTKPQIAIEINKLIQEHKIETSKVIAEDITDAKIEEIIEAFNNKEAFRTAEEFADKSYNTNSLKADALINIDLEIDQAISDVKVRLNFGTLTYKGSFEELENSMIGIRNTLSDLTIEVELDIMNNPKHGRYNDSKGNFRENAFTDTLTADNVVNRKPKDDNEVGVNINILRDAISKATPTDKKSLGEVKLKEVLQAFEKLDRALNSMKVQKEIIKNGQNKVNNSCK